MASALSDNEPKPGDLIEIFRGTCEHWALYIGDGFIIHLVPTDDSANASSSSKSVISTKAKVKEEKLLVVVGKDKYRINNRSDAKHPPKHPNDIVRKAKSMVGQELPYSVFQRNCEHFVTELKYGKAESPQVQKALGTVAEAALVGMGILATAASADFIRDNSKEKKNDQ